MNKGKHTTVHQLHWSYQPVLPFRYDVKIRAGDAGSVKTVTVYLRSNKTKGAAADAVLNDNKGAVCVAVNLVR